MPAWVAVPTTPLAPGRHEDLQQEWQAARSVVDRLDGTLVDLRKYGFGLASGLLTTNGVIFGLVAGGVASPQVVAVVIAVTMLLAAVLFVVDQYYHMIQWAATKRATDLEAFLSLGLSSEILRWARWQGPELPRVRSLRTPESGQELAEYLSVAGVWTTRFIWRNLAPIQYGSFVLVAGALGIALLRGDAVPAPNHAAADFMWIVFVFSFALMWAVRWLAGRERLALSNRPRTVAGVIRIVAADLTSAPKVGPKKHATGELSLAAGEAGLAMGTSALAVVKPTVQGALCITGCGARDDRHLRITLFNPGSTPVTPIQGERYQVFVY